MQGKQRQLRWRFGLAAAAAIVFLALFPQLHFWFAHEGRWGGSFAYFDTDEVAYAAYLNALIDGRPRRNDPYTGRDDQPGARQPESLFSVQFIPPYAAAGLARLFHLKATTVFIVLLPIAALASTLAIFWLVWTVLGDDRYAAVAALVVLCLGTLASFQGAIRELVGSGFSYNYLPFVRRYIPALPFNHIYLMCALVWRMLASVDKRRAWRNALWAGLVFVLQVFSYFYLWTTAATWLGALALLWLITRREEARRRALGFAIIAASAFIALVPYFYLLSRRAETMDKVQVLTSTHAPEILRSPQLLGLLSLLALGVAAWRGRILWRDRATLFAASFAIVPVAVFNQQVLTGRSLQPIHYEQFIANYVSLVAVVLTVALIWRGRAVASRRFSGIALGLVALAAFGWGFYETRQATMFYFPFNAVRDEAAPVALRLAELDRELLKNGQRPVVFYTNLMHGDDLPTYAPQAVLWAPHMHVFSGVTLAENKERFYQALYYTGVTAEQLQESINGGDFYTMVALFGWERTNPNLAVEFNPVRPEEILAEVQNYASYTANFNRDRASSPALSYLVTEDEEGLDLSNLDRWYEREAIERIGRFTLYRVRLKNP